MTFGAHLFDRTLATPAENLACDEALLDKAEAEDGPAVLRFWEAPHPFVVLGFANQIEQEVDRAACLERAIPILRRCSGGGTVLQGPGCLNYALVLKAEADGPLRTITSTNTFVMQRHRQVCSALLGREATVEGATDLAVGSLKFSGNAQRRRRQWLLFHGTFLYDFDLGLIERVLRVPPREPEYRRGRSHRDFLTQLTVGREAIQRAIAESWGATGLALEPPAAAMTRLLTEKYANERWTNRC